MSGTQDRLARKAAQKKKARRRKRGPYRKSWSRLG